MKALLVLCILKTMDWQRRLRWKTTNFLENAINKSQRQEEAVKAWAAEYLLKDTKLALYPKFTEEDLIVTFEIPRLPDATTIDQNFSKIRRN